MKKFMERYSYESVHLFLNQIAIGLFGLTLALAAGKAQNEALRIFSSVFAVMFFLVLQLSHHKHKIHSRKLVLFPLSCRRQKT